MCVGGTIPDLEVDATGPGAIDWEWQLYDGAAFNPVSTGNAPNDGTNPTYSAPTNIAGIYEYRCIVNFSSGGCSSQTSDTIVITIIDDPVITLSTPTVYQMACVGFSPPITPPLSVIVTGGVGTPSWIWYDNAGVTVGTNSTFTPNLYVTPGLYEYYVEVDYDGNGCDPATSNIAQIDVIDIPTATFSTAVSICYEHPNPDFINSNSVSLGTGPYGVTTNSYWEIIDNAGITVWDNLPGTNPVSIPSFTTAIWSTLQQGVGPVDYSIKLTVENQCGANSYIEPLTINPRPQPAFVTSSTPNCFTDDLPTNVYAGQSIDLILNNVGTFEATPLSDPSCLPPPLGLGPNGNTDYITLTAPGSSLSGPTNYYPECNPSNPNMNWPDPNISLAPYTYPPINLVYNTVGTYNICIEGFNTNTYGCAPDTFCCDINVTASTVTSNFIVSTNDDCEDDNYIFTDLSTFDPFNQTQWCFDFDPINNVPNPGANWTSAVSQPGIPYNYTHTFTNPGCFYVALKTKNTLSGDEHIYVYQDLNGPIPFVIHPKPNTDFIPHDVCIGVQDNWLDNSSINDINCNGTTIAENISSRVWDVKHSNGPWLIDVASGAIDLTYTFPISGTWTIRLTCTSDEGCISTQQHDIIVHDLPTAEFTSVYNPSCVNNNVFFNGNTGVAGGSTNSSTGTIDEWDWDFNDSYCTILPACSLFNSSSNGDANHTYTVNSSYNVTLTVSDDNGCTSLPTTNQIFIDPLPTASFTATTECLNIQTQLDGTSSSTSTDTWVWEIYDPQEIGGFTVQTTTIPFNSYEFSTPGYHNVILTTYSTLSNGQVCISQPSSQQVYVYDLPQPSFSFNVACENNVLGVNEITNFTDLTPSSTINSISGLTDALITIYDYVWNFNGPQINSPPGNTSWTFGVPNFYPGYPVSLFVKDDNGCTNTFYDTVAVSNLPNPDITFTSSITGLEACEGDIVQVSDNTVYTDFVSNSINWSISPAAPITTSSSNPATINLSNVGTHTITLDVTDINNCPATTSIIIDVWDNPTAVINPITTVCEDSLTPTNLTHSSLEGSGALIQYYWDFGDLTYDTILSPFNGNTTHFYNCGSYDVNLTVTDDNGCTNFSTTEIATVNCNPTANFNVLPVCLDPSSTISSNFTSTSIPIPGTNITSYNYEFNDPNLGTQNIYSNPGTWAFSEAGSFAVTLTIVDDQSPVCTDERTKYALVHELPTISFTAPEVCEGEITILTAISNHPIINYLWNIDTLTGDYVPPYDSTDYQTQFEFNNASASHIVSVTVVDDNNCVNSTIPSPVEVWANPQANIDIDPNQAFCLYENIQIDDNSIFGSGTINYWDWDFGLNSSPTTLCCNTDNSLVNYNSWGWKTISLYVEDDNSCNSDISVDIYINQLPNAYFTTNSPLCFGDIVEFENKSILGEPANYFTTFEWEFYNVDGTINGTSQQLPSNPPLSNDLIQSHDYSQNIISTVGAYVSAQLIVTDIEGCTSTYNSLLNNPQQNIEIHPLPIVDFSVNDICEDDNFIFIDNSTMDNNSVFPNDQLTTTNSDPISNPIFDYNGLFNSNTGNMNGGSWIPPLWTLPTNSLIANYPNGVPVKLTRETDFGCIGDTVKYPIIKLSPNIDFTVSYDPINRCGEDVKFSLYNNYFDLTSDFKHKYIIQNFQGAQISELQSIDIINYNFDLPGAYYLNIELDNNNGCIADSTYNIYINPNPISNFIPSITEECEDILIDFTDLSTIPNNNVNGISTNIVSWEWDLDTIQPIINSPDDGNTFFTFNSISSPYDIYLTVITDSGCTDIFGPTTIIVNPTPIADFVTPLVGENGKYLFDGTITTTSNGLPASPPQYNYSWEIEDGSNIVNVSPNDDIQLDGTEDYGYYWYNSLINDAWLEVCLFVENDYGCIGDTCKDVRIDHFNNLIVPNFLYPSDPSSGASEFLPKGKSLDKYRLQIFDKFGNLLWETTALDENGSPTVGWKGTSLNGIVPQGTYVWRIEAFYSDGEPWLGILYNGKRKKSGFITLVR